MALRRPREKRGAEGAHVSESERTDDGGEGDLNGVSVFEIGKGEGAEDLRLDGIGIAGGVRVGLQVARLAEVAAALVIAGVEVAVGGAPHGG
jgi:hypothetical protein